MSTQNNAKRIADVLLKIGPKDTDIIQQGIINNIGGNGSVVATVNGSVSKVTPVTDDDYRPGGLAWMIKTKDLGYVVLGPAR